MTFSSLSKYKMKDEILITLRTFPANTFVFTVPEREGWSLLTGDFLELVEIEGKASI